MTVAPIRAPKLSLSTFADKWVYIIAGLVCSLVLATSLVTLARVNSLRGEVAAMSRRLDSATASEELTRTRYETEIQSLHELKVAIDTQAAWYQEDIRSLLFVRGK